MADIMVSEFCPHTHIPGEPIDGKATCWLCGKTEGDGKECPWRDEELRKAWKIPQPRALVDGDQMSIFD